MAAAIDLAQTGYLGAATKRKQAVSHAVKAASEVLGNTPTVARASYVDPRLLDAYEHGETIDPARTPRRRVRSAGVAVPPMSGSVPQVRPDDVALTLVPFHPHAARKDPHQS